ncbi:MAG: EAL domain-containing protein [Tahibacter sp.]
MSFRLRLVVFIVATLAVIQAFTAVLVYDVTRQALMVEGRRQLSIAAGAFAQQLNDISARVADTVQVLSLDYALRSAIAQRDRDTVLSALRNHGRRIGAARMMLLNLDGSIEADTSETPGVGATFPFPELLNNALERQASAVVAWDGRAYWTVVVPVFAPALTGLIAASIPIDDALLARMQRQSALPQSVELAARNPEGRWTVLAGSERSAALTAQLQEWIASYATEPRLLVVDGREYMALAIRLSDSQRNAPVAVVMGYSLDDALRPYRPVAIAWASLLGLGLLVGLAGALLIARDVSRPIEVLAASARRIASGDYASPPAIRRHDEIGDLAAAFATMARAIGEREEHIRFQAGHDAVTGLPNRTTAEIAIQQQLSSGEGRSGALLMIALARLPEIVKTMGHAIGDRVMRDAAQRLRPPTSGGLMARATDSEFAVWLPRADRADAISTAFRVLDALGEPYQEADLAVDVSPAVGIALAFAHGAEASTLLQRAEVALFGALGNDDAVAVYDPLTDPHRPARLSLMTDLRLAIDRGDLQLHYQPKLNISLGIVDGGEALVRWQHAKHGAIAPDDFIGLAEETGNVRRLTRWALASSIAQASAWNARGLNLRVAVNLSARDLDDTDLPRRISELLSIHALSPDRIVLELTESAVMGKPDAAIQVLRRLAEQGIDLAIDDFGVGQSSFAYLRRLPVRELKIDKTFVEKLGSDSEDRSIVHSIVELGHRLGYRVTAEGVEDAGALDYLQSIGCDHAQGYYISRALAPESFESFLVDHARRFSAAEVAP